MTIKYSTICVCITLNLFSYLVFTFFLGFPGGSDAEESACSTGDLGLIPGLGRLPGEGNGNLLQYSCLESSMDRGTWWKYSPWNSPAQHTGVGSCSLLQGIFPTQGSNPGLLYCRQILYQLSNQGSPESLAHHKSNPPSLGLIEQCTEFRGTFYLVGYNRL